MGKINIISIIFIFMGCGLLSDNSPKKLYKEFMNMDVPSDLKNFQGEGEIVIPEFMSSGYFIYEADEKYFQELAHFNKFTEVNNKNLPFIERPLFSYELKNLSFWTKGTKLEKNISLKNKRTYIGTNYPWQHYLLRDTLTNKTYHFVSGIKD